MDQSLLEKYFTRRANVLDVLSIILQKIKDNEALSLIRLGDGEGRLLGYPELMGKAQMDHSDADNKYLDYSLNIWFGRTDYDESMLRDVSLQLRQAVSNADIIGLPRQKQFFKHGAYRLVFDALEQFNINRPHHVYTDAAIHRYLQFGLFYSLILNNLDFVGLITGRKGLASVVKQTFNIKHVEAHIIPEEALYANNSVAEHFPDRFESLKTEIHPPFNGAVYLVGAGALGKIYCDWIKKTGGIAIDIGSICDSWAKEGRKMHEYHNIEHFCDLSLMSFREKAGRFNQLADHFKMDTARIEETALANFIEQHGE